MIQLADLIYILSGMRTALNVIAVDLALIAVAILVVGLRRKK